MKRTRIRLDRNVAPCSRPTTNVIDPLHECKKVCPCISPTPVRHSRMNQARSEEERQERQRPGGWWLEMQPKKTKNLSAELKQGLPIYRHSSG